MQRTIGSSTAPNSTQRPPPFTIVVITPAQLAPPSSREFETEVRAVRTLFTDAGLARLHLRKPGADPDHVAAYLSALEPEHRRRVVVHGAAVAGTALARRLAPFAARGELGGVHYRELDRAESARMGHAFWEEGGDDDDGRRRLLRSSGYHSLAAAVGGREVVAAAAAEAAAGGGAAGAEADDDEEEEEEQQQEDAEPWPASAYLDYCFLSPVYDSISKAGYRSAGFLRTPRRRARLAAALARAPLPVFALGGVEAGRVAELRAAGFAGAAVIGAVWSAAEGGGPMEAYRRLVEEAAGEEGA